MVIPAAVRDEIVAHARAGLPNEACGILAGTGDRVERFYPAEPDEPSPFYYRIESRDQIRIMNAIDDAGLDLVGIYHSHVASPAYPSRTDAEQAFWPEAVYVIVSLAGGGFHYLTWDNEGTEVARWLNGLGVTAFVLVTQSARPRGGLEDAFERWPWVEECHHIAGEESLLLKVRAESTRALEHVLWEIRALDSVERTKTIVALTTEFEGRPVAPVPVEEDVPQSGAA